MHSYVTERASYQTLHFFLGFIGEPRGQLKALAKSSLFDRGPKTRTGPGECTLLRIFVRASSGLMEPHHICA
ncbi:hypothetical protein X777_06087 [Ooceraea biroi]|uniref:Uncharacterized protein n=1 Tax=Ooceraea biroi TaxID=2015173 RepID=A0A026WDU8_OOCBI|nr:hypothetical protein X777_06087 [Ooceraea biroi]